MIALREDGRPHPFQVTASRTARRTGEPDAGLSAFLFDLVHLDGEDLIDRPGAGAVRGAGPGRAASGCGCRGW